MGNNLNASKFKQLFKSKNFVTGLCAVLIVLVLVIGYNMRINSATKPVTLPVAKDTIQPKTLITEDMIEYKEVPNAALGGNFKANANEIIGMYTNVNTIIPAGSMFYTEALTSKDDLPDTALYDKPEDETLYYLTVNMLTTFSNSILPGNYIDIYISTKDDAGKAMVGKLLENVKILAVKTSDGKNVFEDSTEQRTPYVLIFSLPEEQHLLMRKIDAINDFSVTSESGSFARMEIIPVPTTVNFTTTDEKIERNIISSEYLESYILDMASTLLDEE